MRLPYIGAIVALSVPTWAHAAAPGNVSGASPGHNGMGAGPYAAVVTQVFDGETQMVNLQVLAPFAATPVHMGSVPFKDYAGKGEGASWDWIDVPADEPKAKAK